MFNLVLRQEAVTVWQKPTTGALSFPFPSPQWSERGPSVTRNSNQSVGPTKCDPALERPEHVPCKHDVSPAAFITGWRDGGWTS